MAGNRVLPLSKEQHKRLLFKSLKDAVRVGLQYMELWTHDPSEQWFVDWIDDVLKSLPFNEAEIPPCSYQLFANMTKRAEKCPIRIVENVPEFGPIPEPAHLICSNGTSSLIEQIPCAKAKLPALDYITPFEMVCNAQGTLPSNAPFTATFIPAVPLTRKDFFLRGISCEVKANGDMDIEDAPPVLAPEQLWPRRTGKKDRRNLDAVSPDQVALGSEDHPSITTCDPPVRVVTSFPRKPRSNPQEVNDFSTILPVVHSKPVSVQEQLQRRPTSNGHAANVTSNTSTTTSAHRPRHMPTAPDAGTIPFPSMSTPYADPSTLAPRTVPRHVAPAYRGDPNSVWSPNPPPDVPFNHFPPHPQARMGQLPPSGKVGLQRAHAFMHKSHPEIFWTDEYGEPPKPDEKRTIEDCLPSASDRPIKPLKRSPQEVVGGDSTAGSGAAGPSRPRGAGSSSISVRKRKGKKRAREDDDAVEESRPVQRIRANSAGEATPIPFSHRIKAAVAKLTGGAFLN